MSPKPRDLFGRTRLASRDAPPTVTHELAQCRSDRAGRRDLNVVMGWQKSAVEVDASKVLRPMFRRVPASLGQIEATDECDGIVNDDNLAVMGSADGMISIHMKMHPGVALPPRSEERQYFTLQRVNHREIPCQNMNMETRPARCQ